MRFVKVLPIIVVVCVSSITAVRAEEPCPAGPFETDAHVIAAVIAAHPLRPRVWDASGENWASPPTQLADGAFWESSGGLENTTGHSLMYDAKRYVVASVLAEFGPRKARIIPLVLPNQIVSRRRNATFTTTITRPTPDEARRFACLANQLLAPPPKEDSSNGTQTGAHPSLPGILAVVTAGTGCDPRPAAYFVEGSDEYSETFQVLVAGSTPESNTESLCFTGSLLLHEM